MMFLESIGGLGLTLPLRSNGVIDTLLPCISFIIGLKGFGCEDNSYEIMFPDSF